VRLIAHRGFAAVHPENTVRAVRAAAEVADLVEVDVRRCGSGELVLCHDETVDRVTDETGPVSEHTLAELHDLDVLDSGEPIPTLSAVLDAVPPDVGLLVECKEAAVAPDVVALAAGRDVDVVVTSFDTAALERAATAGEFPLAYTFARDPRAALSTAQELDCVAVHPHHELCDAAFVRRAHALGLSVHAWTVADVPTAGRVAAAGVDGVIADAPGVLEAI
jgi:glycerophosphoryl diester phosphodiesterase